MPHQLKIQTQKHNKTPQNTENLKQGQQHKQEFTSMTILYLSLTRPLESCVYFLGVVLYEMIHLSYNLDKDTK